MPASEIPTPTIPIEVRPIPGVSRIPVSHAIFLIDRELGIINLSSLISLYLIVSTVRLTYRNYCWHIKSEIIE